MLSRCFLDFSVGVRASVIGLSQISSFSLKSLTREPEPETYVCLRTCMRFYKF